MALKTQNFVEKCYKKRLYTFVLKTNGNFVSETPIHRNINMKKGEREKHAQGPRRK
jgi:hypothetical protein